MSTDQRANASPVIAAVAGSPLDDDPEEAARIQQYEFVWVWPSQYQLARFPDGFALEVIDFLGPGDPDFRGERTVWVRGPVVEANRRRAETIKVAVPHDQPRAGRSGGAVLHPPVPGAFEPQDAHRRAPEEGIAPGVLMTASAGGGDGRGGSDGV